MSDQARVLIIDDESETVSMLKSFFELFSYSVAGVGTGKEAFKLIPEFRPDVIILDLMLPDTTGYEICRMLRRASSTMDLPVIILSARSAREDVREGYRAGATRYLKKPVDLDSLKNELRAVLEVGHHEPPSEATQLEDAIRPATGYQYGGSNQYGISMPVRDDDIDFVMGAEPAPPAKPKHPPGDKHDTIKIPGMFIKRERDEEAEEDDKPSD